MRNEIIQVLNDNPDYYLFLRQNPEWHRELSRYPDQYKNFIEYYKTKRRKRLVDRLEDFNLMTGIFSSLNQNN